MRQEGLRRVSPLIFILTAIVIVAAIGCSDDKGTTPGDPAGYLNAHGITGGKLFDKFWSTEAGWNQFDPNIATYAAYADFFRCKQCHGWDLRGNTGAYISRGPRTTRPNVTGIDLYEEAAASTPQELFDEIKKSSGRRSVSADLSTYDPNTNKTVGDQMPNFGSIFTDDQIWDLVKFLKEEAINVDDLYDAQTTGTYPTGSIAYSNIGKSGSASNGDVLYTAKCAACHGADGRMILVDDDTYSIGSFVRAKPNEAQHKIKFGQPGSAMGSQYTELSEIRDIYKALTNTTTYPDPE